MVVGEGELRDPGKGVVSYMGAGDDTATGHSITNQHHIDLKDG